MIKLTAIFLFFGGKIFNINNTINLRLGEGGQLTVTQVRVAEESPPSTQTVARLKSGR